MLGFVGLAASAWAAPGWVSRIEQDYPRALYLKGVGSADNIEMARQRAISTLAQGVRVQVKSQLQTSAEQTLSKSAGQSQLSERQQIRDNTQLSSDLELPGADIVKLDYDSGEGQHYALAVIDKRQLQSFWRNKIQTLTQQAQENLEWAQQALAREPLRTLQWSKKAQSVLAQAEDYQQNLNVIAGPPAARAASAPAAEAGETGSSLAQLRSQSQQLLRKSQAQTQIFLQAERRASTTVQAALLDALTQQGLKVSSGGSDKTHYRLQYDLSLQTAFRRDESWWQVGTLQLELLQAEQTLSKISIPLKVASASPQMLALRLQQRIQANVAEQLPQLLCSDCSAEDKSED